MGLSHSVLSSVWKVVVKYRVFGLETGAKNLVIMRSLGFDDEHEDLTSRSVSLTERESENISASQTSNKKTIEKSLSFKYWEPEKVILKTADSFMKQSLETDKSVLITTKIRDNDEGIQSEARKFLSVLASPRPKSELDAAAVKLQKVYKSYRTRRNLADCAVVVEELWWKALDFAALKQSSVSYFDIEKPETAFHRWTRARTRAAKVGKGLSKDEKARKLALQHWLEAIDPRHRYGHNLHFYYDVWFDSESTQPFFYWLDVGNGKEINLDRCPRNNLQRQCIKYLGPNEREAYEVIVDSGNLVYKQSGMVVDTDEGSKWIFVLSTTRSLYVGQKKKGVFQHSSFLSGGATTAAGRLVANNGVLKAIWPYSGHYLPTEDNFQEFISFLEEHNVDLTNVKRCAADEDSPSFISRDESQTTEADEEVECPSTTEAVDESAKDTTGLDVVHNEGTNTEAAPAFDLGRRLSCKWTTGTGPRIGCVRDYPMELQSKALEQVNLSPRINDAAFGPIPSPRPSPKIRLSPRLAYMGLPSPRVTLPNSK